MKQSDTKERELEMRINELENDIRRKIDSNIVKDKIKKVKKDLEDEIQQNIRQYNKRMLENEQRVEKELLDFKVIVEEIEKKTYWKLQDHQMLIEKRPNEDYIQQMLD